MSNDKRSAMEAEMNRFEAEIGVPVAPYQGGRHVIGANTYLKVQQQLEQHTKISAPPGMPFLPMLPTVSSPEAIASLGGIPPPPPPPSMLIPHQVHRPMMLIRPPMNDPRHERPRAPVVPAIVTATPKLYTPNKPVLPTVSQAHMAPGPSSSKKSRKAAKAKEAEKVILPPANVGPSFSLEELGPKRSKERRMERAERGGKKAIRTAGGQVWEDCSLQDWPEDDFRIFCGDLGNDVTDEVLTRAFNKFPSFQKAKVVRDKRTNKTKGFGFVSFKDPQDFINAMKEMNGRYVGSRPIKLRKSMWRNRNADVVRKKERERTQLIGLLTGR